MDLDTVIVADVTTLFDRPEDFVIWGESDFPKTTWYNGSLWLLTAGSRRQVWETFNTGSPLLTRRANARGSDQGWISYVLGPKEATFGRQDGVYSYRKDILKMDGVLPENARIICFHGKVDPWAPEGQVWPWVQEHWGRVA
jgi:hypothetical protein